MTTFRKMAANCRLTKMYEILLALARIEEVLLAAYSVLCWSVGVCVGFQVAKSVEKIVLGGWRL